MPTRRRTLLGAVCLLAVAPAAEAQYVQRQVVTTTGAVTFIGNSLGLNKAASGDQPGTNGSVGAFITTNTTLQKTGWPPGTTSDWKLNSSTAVLNLPAGSTVIYAELIWGGSWAYGGENVSAFLNDPVNLTTPAGTTSVARDPATAKTGGTPGSGGNCTTVNPPAPCFYTRTANVTGLIQAGGNGTYTVGRVPGTQGASEPNLNAAGWTLAIVYRNFSLPTRNLSLFVGLEPQDAAPASVSGFCTTDSATQSGRVAVSVVEGDTQFSGDSMRFGPDSATLGQDKFRLWGPNNLITNFFASQINGDDGLLDKAGTFGSRNNSFSGTLFAGGRQSWDITNVDASAQLTRKQTIAFAQGTTNQDQFSINALGLQIDVGAPRFAFDGATTVDRGTAVLGDTLTYTVRLDNRSGQADAAGVVFKVPLPAGTSFVPGSFTLDGTKPPGANPVTGVAVGTVAVGDVHTVTFQLHVDAIPTPPAPAKIDVTPTWSYTFISCAGQPAQPGTFATNTAVTGLARIDATKSVTPSSSQPNQILSYSISLTNTGTAPSNGTLVNDAIPLGTIYMPGSTTLNGTAVADQTGTSPLVVGMLVSSLGASPGVLLPGGGAVVGFQVRVDPSRTTDVVNTAVIDPDGPSGPVPSFQRSVTTAITPQADLSVTKAGPSTAVAGTSITYTINVGNAGPSVATAVSLTDPTPAGLTLVSVTGACTILPCSLGDLASGATRTVTVTFAIPGAYTTPDPIVNTASVTSTTADPSPGNNSTSASTARNAPVADLRVTNTNGVTSVVPGTTTTYTITVTNLGPSTATNAVVTDLFPAVLTGVTWTCVAAGGAVCGAPAGAGNIVATVTVPVGGMLTFTATGTISSAATGTLVNTVTAVPAAGTSDPNPASATDSDPITLQADLSVTKTGPPTVALGGNITYTIHVANAGPSAATNVTISDPFPPGLTFISTTAPCSTSPCNIGTLAAGETGTARLTFNVPVGFTGTTVSNTARITSDTPDPSSSNNESTTQATVIRDADVGLVKSVTPDAGVVNDRIKFILTAFNDGPAAASGVVVTDLLPAGLSFVSAFPSQGDYDSATGAWTAGTIAADHSATLTLEAVLTQAGTFTNLSTISGQDQPDPNSSNNTAEASINAAAHADVSVLKTVDNAAPLVGQTVTFTTTLSNQGPSPATGIVVTDALPAGLTLVTATPSQGTYATPTWAVGDMGVAGQATLTVVATVAAPGTIVNTAVKTAQVELDLNPVNDRSSASLNAAASANLSIAKTVSNRTPAVGETVKFDVIVTNQGPTDATGVVISDQLPTGLTFISAAPSDGSFDQVSGLWTLGALNATGTAVLALTARVSQTGGIINTASVSASEPDPDPANNTASATVTASAIVDLAVTKTLTGAAIPGFPTTYTIVVTNHGPSPVTGANVTDLFSAAFVAPAWTCVADAGSACAAASGAGNIATTVNLQAAGSATFTATGLIASGASGLLLNTATVDAPAGVTDPNLINNSSTSSDQLLPSADLQIGKTGPAQATAGTNITYTITVTNAGPSDAASVSVADPTPTGLTFVSNAGDCTTAFPCSLGTIPPGVSRAITSTFAVPAGYTTPDPIVNPATVSSVTPDPAPGNNTATAMTAIAAPVMNLGITKTNGASTVVPGTVTTYTITVSNAGPSNAIGATVIDNLPAVLSGATWSCTGAGGATCNVASGSGNINTTANIPAGAATITFLVSATIAPDATGTLVNTASVTPPPNASDPSSANSTVSDSLTPQADVAITKTGPASIVPGNTLVYTIAVTNTGPSDADGVVVDDPTPSGLTFVSNAGDCTTPFPCSLGTMPPGSSQVITSTFAVPQGYTTPAPIVNVAHVSTTTTDPNPSNNSVTLPTSLITDADVDVTKSMPTTTVHVGDVIAVTIDLVNHGPNQARGIEITDNLPAGLDFVSATATQGSYDETTGLWTTGSLAVNDTAQLVINATVTSAGDITNLAVKTGQNEPDPNTANDTAGATTSALPAADVALEKIVDRSDALVGETVTFTVRATNRGPSPATGVTIADTMPTGGLTFVSATPSQGSYDAATGTWTVGSLDLQSEATLSIVTTVDQPGALVNNAAVLTQDQFDPNPLNNSAAASVNAAPNADLRVTKAVSDSAPGVGTLLTYTVAVTNFGPSDATIATIHDLLPSGLTFVSAQPSQGTYDPTTGVWTIGAIPVTATRVLSITARVTAVSSLVNTATRQSSTPVDPNPANDGDDVTSAPSLIADLAVTKTPGSPAVAAGTEASWTIVVTNNGPSDVVGASVTDVLPAGLTGATWTCAASAGSACGALSGAGSIATTVNLVAGGTATFLVTGLVAPSVTGPLVNTASVAVPPGTTDPDLTNNGPDPDLTNEAASVVEVTAVADVQVTKTGPSSVAPGSTATYTTTIVNVGPSAAAGVTLGESTPPGLVLSTVGGACTAVPCAIGALAPGESRVVTVSFSVPASYVGSSTFAATATVASPSADPDPANNSSSVATTVTVSADLSITKSGPASAIPGSAVTYVITVANAGPSDAASVTVSDPTPAGLTFMSNAGDCTTAFPCSLGTIPAGATRTITATFNVSRSPGPPASIANVATVASTTFDPVPANNTGSAVISSVSRSVRCDIDGDGVEEIVTGAGPGGDPHVRVFNLAKGTEMASFYAYDLPFGGGVFVACGDVDGDGLADVITGKGPGGDPHVRAFSLASGSPVEIASFNAYAPTFAGGVHVAVGDVNGDGRADIITGAGPGGAPHVRAFSLASGGLTEVASFLAYDPGFTGGVFVASGDVNGDGIAEIVTGTYQGGGPVRVFDVGPLGVSELTSFFAYFSEFHGPVRVAVADVNGDGVADIITAAGPGGGPHVRAFSLAGGGLSELASFYAYDPAFCDVGSSPDPVECDGVYVTGADVTGDGVAEIITGTNQAAGGPVRIFQVGPGGVTELTHFFAYFSKFRGPVRVAAADVGDPRRNSAGPPWMSGREDRTEPARSGLAARSSTFASTALLDRDSMTPSDRGPPSQFPDRHRLTARLLPPITTVLLNGLLGESKTSLCA